MLATVLITAIGLLTAVLISAALEAPRTPATPARID